MSRIICSYINVNLAAIRLYFYPSRLEKMQKCHVTFLTANSDHQYKYEQINVRFK